ncbi:WAT1-related protein At5g64700 isoform X1 [Beta vulgaris subsp. vulgaris]|uniref:WAT1-related protein At5g64700 isoform X1 n=1 Tax=Beta vulgaris subsp. vulgaris TaxID=3555 RepID=UPI002548FC4C|nr:WAT1-related protein At5g64700 isoform X1 [Beta vulgaris subsp. vulgaris]
MALSKPILVVFFIQTLYTGMFLLSKAAFNVGMNNFIFTFYRQALATIFLAPIAIFLERNKIPPLSFKTFWQIFAMSLFGITLSLDLYGIGLTYTSATMGAATTNCLPVITFFLAVLFRLEIWKLKTASGIAKLVGVVICLGGATTLALYKGPSIKLFSHSHLLFGHPSVSQQPHNRVHSSHTWIKGVFILLSGNTFWALWLVMQARIMKGYPSKLLFTALSCFFSSIQSFALAILVERRPSQWMLGWNIRLVAVAYCGIVVTGLAYTSTEKAICVGCEAPICVGLWCDAKALDANDSETICVVCGNDADGSAICVAPVYGTTQVNLTSPKFHPQQPDLRRMNHYVRRTLILNE